MLKSIFFDLVRHSVFGGKLTVVQVAGLERIIAEANKRNINNEHLAYCLATTAWEGAYTMQPITERGARSYFDKYEPGTRIGKALGNSQLGDGYKYRGRGDVMLTGRSNYARASIKLGLDLLYDPDIALKPEISVQILFSGMQEGWFTSKKLDDYLDGIDESDKEDLREFANARAIVNGKDKQIEIAKIALNFEHALRASNRPDKVPVINFPEDEPAKPVPPAPQKQTLVSLLVALFNALFGVKA